MTVPNWDDIPVYPGASQVSHLHCSLVGGGGGFDARYTTGDPVERVVAFYEQSLGPADRDAGTGECVWRSSEPLPGGWVTYHLVVVGTGPPGAGSSGGDAVTGIHIGRRAVPPDTRPDTGG